MLRVHFSRAVYGRQYLVLSKFNECRAVGIFHRAYGYLYFAKLVNSSPICPFPICVNQISCLSHFSSTSNSSSTSSMVDAISSDLGVPPTGARDVSCCGGVSGTFKSTLIRCVRFAVCASSSTILIALTASFIPSGVLPVTTTLPFC